MNSFKFHSSLEISSPEFNTSTQLRFVEDDSFFGDEHFPNVDATDCTISASESHSGQERQLVDDVIDINAFDDTSIAHENAQDGLSN